MKEERLLLVERRKTAFGRKKKGRLWLKEERPALVERRKTVV